ncbi:MAG: hypothetical protein M3173_02605, partial [Chloroflexota bacterium]|nr:hypothetical protein [Chloroflexota bacterium]
PDASAGVGSAVSIIDTRDAANLVARRIGGLTPEQIDAAVTVERREETSVVSVTARAADAASAAELATAFAKAALDAREADLNELASTQIRRSRRLLELSRAGEASFVAVETLRARIADLRQIVRSGDPTLSLVREAVVPDKPDGAPAILIAMVSLASGIALGCAAAILIEILGPAKISDEDSLLELYPLPVLARLPAIPSQGNGAISSRELSALREGHRGLRAQIAFQVSGTLHASVGRNTRTRSVAITSPSRGDGKTVVASNLAYAAARAGESCSIVNLDFSSRSIELLLGARASNSEVTSLPGPAGAPFSRMPVGTSETMEVLSLPDHAVESGSVLEHAGTLIDVGRLSSDWVIVDTPAIADSAETLGALRGVDALVVVVSLKRTRRTDLLRLREVIGLAELTPLGFAVVAPAQNGHGLRRILSRLGGWRARRR